MCSISGDPAGELRDAVGMLAGLPVTGLSVGQLQALIAGTTAQADRLAGIVSRAVGELHARTGGAVPDPTEDNRTIAVSHWLRDTTRVSGITAGRQIRTALALRELPAVRDAIVTGATTVAHAQQLTALVGRIDPATLLASQQALLDVADRTDPHTLGRYVEHLLATYDEPGFEDRQRRAEEGRYFQLTDGHDGTWTGRFRLPDAAAEIIKTILEPLARATDLTDPRRPTQRRADALTDIFDLAGRFADLPHAGGQRPTVSYLISADWMDRHGQPAHQPGTPMDPYLTPGPTAAWTGPQSWAHTDTIMCDARAVRLFLDSNGQAQRLDAPTDSVTTAQRRALSARDNGCVAKGCTRPPAFCDAHHLQPRADGGPTTLDNLVLLCRRHHTAWHRAALEPHDLRGRWLSHPSPSQPAPRE